MKKLVLLIFVLLFINITANSQLPCLPEGITFTTQEQIDNFQTNYPGCTEIEGDVVIGGWSNDITNLNGLNVLTFIGGGLSIGWPDDLPALNSLTGLNNLDSIGGTIYIVGCDIMTNLTGLENLTYIGGDIFIQGNNSLVNLSGLDSLQSIGGSLIIGGDYWSFSNSSLIDFSGLDGLDSIGGNVEIINNPALTSIIGLENLQPGSIDNLTICKNYNLSNCDVQSVCDYLTAPNGVVAIYNNSAGCNNAAEIASSCGFAINCLPYGSYIFMSQNEIDNFQTNYPGCTELEGNVFIYGNISNLNGLNVVTSIGGSLNIGNYNSYDALSSLTGLENLTFIGGSIEISHNDALTSLSGLESFISLGGHLNIYNNFELASLTGLESLTSIGEGISISYNNILANLSGLESLTSIGGGLYIDDNPTLASLSGLENLTSLGGSLTIGYFNGNPALSSLSGLESLKSIGGDLSIIYNNVLTSLSGLDNIDAGSVSNLYVIDNALLSACDVQSICNFLVTPYGTIEIYNNAAGCNSMEEVLEACNDVSCLPEGIFFETQADVDNFHANYPGCLEIEGGVFIHGDDITNLDSLITVISIGGSLSIVLNESITNIEGLENLTLIGGNLTITGNPNLSSCDVQSICEYLSVPSGLIDIHDNASGCNSPEEVQDACSTCLPEGITFTTQEQIDNFQTNYTECTDIEGNVTIDGDDITNLNGLSELTSIEGNFLIGKNDYPYHANPLLTSLTGLESLTSIGGDLRIAFNDSLTSLAGLESLAFIGGNLRIYWNFALNSLSGIESLTAIGGYLSIEETQSLTSLTGLESLSSIGEELRIAHNLALISLTGLESLTSIGGDLLIYGNYALPSLTGMANLTYIGGSLTITWIYALTSLTGLESLTSIGGDLWIYYNDSLTSLTGLENIYAGSISNLKIYNNNLLSTCDVQSICDYLSAPNGTIEIYYNAPGCNSPEEVEEHCLTGIENQSIKNEITIIPNPSNNTITISSSAITGKTLLTIFNVNGEKVIERQITENETQIDISALTPGVYFVRMQNEAVVEVGKMSKK